MARAGGRTPGVPDPSSSAGAGQAAEHTQSVASNNWTISHTLNTKPDVTVVDTNGDQIFAEVTYPDDSTVVVKFKGTYTGTAYLRA